MCVLSYVLIAAMTRLGAADEWKEQGEQFDVKEKIKALFCIQVIINKRGGVYNQFCNQPLGGGQWKDISVRDRCFLLQFSAEYSGSPHRLGVVGDPVCVDFTVFALMIPTCFHLN